jgi:hypothetical protein
MEGYRYQGEECFIFCTYISYSQLLLKNLAYVISGYSNLRPRDTESACIENNSVLSQ